MTAQFPSASIAEVRNRADIVALIGESVRLRKRGAEHIGRCPFHPPGTSESLSVSASKGLYLCRNPSCAASGDAISFLRRMESLSFPQALRQLAERTGVSLDMQPLTPAQQREQAQRLAVAAQIAPECSLWVQRVAASLTAQANGLHDLERRALRWCREHPDDDGPQAQLAWAIFRAAEFADSYDRDALFVRTCAPAVAMAVYLEYRREHPEVVAQFRAWAAETAEATRAVVGALAGGRSRAVGA